jgi:hypothetical protein
MYRNFFSWSNPDTTYRSLERAMRAHIVYCETRVASDTLLIRSMERLGLKNLTLTNLCEGREWRANFFALKYTALRHWLLTRTAAPEDLVLVLDADVIANSAQLSESDLSGRFEDVRGSHRIIFQAEPTCWAEFGASRAVFQSHGCSRHVLAGWGSVAGTHSRNYRCGRFLCGGAFAGFAADLVHLVERMEELRRGSHTVPALCTASSKAHTVPALSTAPVRSSHHDDVCTVRSTGAAPRERSLANRTPSHVLL